MIMRNLLIMITIVFIGVFYFHFLDTMPKKKYAIHSYIKNDNKYYDSVYYTDTLEISGDSIGYHNSDGSYVSINNDNKFIDTLK